jgi:hypothetical protein
VGFGPRFFARHKGFIDAPTQKNTPRNGVAYAGAGLGHQMVSAGVTVPPEKSGGKR